MLQQPHPKALSMVLEKAYQGITHNANEGAALMSVCVANYSMLDTTQTLIVLGH